MYNKVVDFKEAQYLADGKSKNYMSMRKEWKASLVAEHPWITEIPAHTVYGAMMDADKDYNLVVRKRAKGQAHKLPRCRKRAQRSCFVLGNAVTNKGIYPRLIGVLKSSEQLPDHPCDCRLIHDADGRWYLSVPYKVQVADSENQGICALDPGVRTFISGVSDRSCFKIGKGAFGRIVRLCHRLDALISRASKANKKSFRRAIGRARVRIRNLVDDLHYQVVGHLVRSYRTIVFPEANFTSAVKRATRKIRSRTARSLMTFAFAKFRDRLLAKAEVVGVQVITICESYTSKTANWTGEIVQNLGGSKTIRSQGACLDRDINAALGILLKALPDRPFTGTAVTALQNQLVAVGKEK